MHGGGYIQLWRQSLDSQVFHDPVLWKVFCWAALSAEWRDGERLPPGSFRTKVRDAAHWLRLPPTTLHRALRRLVELECLSLVSDRHETVVTVCNWKTYQPSSSSEKARNTNGTKAEHGWNKSGTRQHVQAEHQNAVATLGDTETYGDESGDAGTRMEQKRNTLSEKVERAFSKSGTRSNKEEELEEEELRRIRNKTFTFVPESYPLPSALAGHPAFVEAWQGWLRYLRDEKHKIWSQSATERTLVKLVKLGPDQAVAAIDYSIESDWVSIHPPKKGTKARERWDDQQRFFDNAGGF